MPHLYTCLTGFWMHVWVGSHFFKVPTSVFFLLKFDNLIFDHALFQKHKILSGTFAQPFEANVDLQLD